MIIQNLGYDDILQVFMQKVILTQNDIEDSFKYPVQYEVSPSEIPTESKEEVVPETTEMIVAEAKPATKINPLHLIIGAIILL